MPSLILSTMQTYYAIVLGRAARSKLSTFCFYLEFDGMRIPVPISLNQQSTPFDDPQWIYEIKHDGFRALALIERGDCWFVSRQHHKFNGFQDLATALAREVNAEMAVLDGELAVPDDAGRTVFSAVIGGRKHARYFAFDLLWLNGEDLRALPLLSRKEMLKRIFPSPSMHALYVDHAQGAGIELYRWACQLDLKGIVAKRADSPYDTQTVPPPWIEIKNPTYSQSRSKRASYGTTPRAECAHARVVDYEFSKEGEVNPA